MDWLNQRQEVLSQNIANADSPGYRPQDLKKFKFKELIRRESMQLNMDVGNSKHLGGRRKRIKDFAAEKERKPYETMPAGNAVVLEEQMHKVNETSAKHKITTELYKKHLGMFRTALGRP
ncbi:MAG: flagellar basal body protein [Rhodospirillales bacterium]